MSIRVSYVTKDEFDTKYGSGYTEMNSKDFKSMQDVLAFIKQVRVNPRFDGKVVVGLPTVEA
jgi:hypothetical protein